MIKIEKTFAIISLASMVIFTIFIIIMVILSPYKSISDTLYKLFWTPCVGFFVGSTILPTAFLWLFWNIIVPFAILMCLIYWIIFYPIKRLIIWFKNR